MSPTPKRPTSRRGEAGVRIRDVAELAGVSVGTVSHTLNHPELVRPGTRAAVENAIKELGFVPNHPARVLTGASSQVIGLVVLDVVSPFFMTAARAVERAAHELGHVVILCNSDNSPQREVELLRMLESHQVRGALVAPASLDNRIYQESRLPIVLLDHEESTGDCSVSVDNAAGASLAVAHLLAMGHERIAFVGGPANLRQMAQRSHGARQAMRQAGLDPHTQLIEFSEPGFGIQDGIRAAEELLRTGLPTGIFCGNDMLAFGVYRALRRAGIRIPKDVALIGFDDIDFAADWVVPLSSVRQPTDDLGYRAARLLLEHAAGSQDHQHRQLRLDPELIVRRSSDPAAE